jgi:hypothetical protein
MKRPLRLTFFDVRVDLTKNFPSARWGKGEPHAFMLATDDLINELI